MYFQIQRGPALYGPKSFPITKKIGLKIQIKLKTAPISSPTSPISLLNSAKLEEDVEHYLGF
jgi:hypothetical protein